MAEVVAEELRAWSVDPADLLDVLPEAAGRASLALFNGGQPLEMLPHRRGNAVTCAVYTLLRLWRVVGTPIDGAGCRPSAADVVRAVLTKAAAAA